MTKRANRWFALIAAAAMSVAAALQQPISAKSSDPESQAIATCISKFGFLKRGHLSGHDAVALVMCGGGSSAGISVRLFADLGTSGGVVDLGTIVGGDHMNAFFAGNHAYVSSSIHLPTPTDDADFQKYITTECEQCYTHMLVHGLSVEAHWHGSPTLVDQGIAIIETPHKVSYERDAQHAHFSSTLTFGGRRLRSSDFTVKKQ